MPLAVRMLPIILISANTNTTKGWPLFFREQNLCISRYWFGYRILNSPSPMGFPIATSFLNKRLFTYSVGIIKAGDRKLWSRLNTGKTFLYVLLTSFSYGLKLAFISSIKHFLSCFFNVKSYSSVQGDSIDDSLRG